MPQVVGFCGITQIGSATPPQNRRPFLKGGEKGLFSPFFFRL